MIISFGHTTPALLAGEKTVTRRDWKPSTVSKFKAGDLVDAYDKSPRNGGHKVAIIRIARAPYLELVCEAPYADRAREGFDYLQVRGAKVFGVEPWDLWESWMNDFDTTMYVVRFDLLQRLVCLI